MLKHHTIQIIIFPIILMLAFSKQSYSSTTVGMVTNVSGDVIYAAKENSKVDFGDDLIFNDKIKIGHNSSLSLTYFDGCRREWFNSNSSLDVGKNKSTVLSGSLLKSDNFDCTIPKVSLDENGSFRLAAKIFRTTHLNKSAVEVQTSKKTYTWGDETNKFKLTAWTSKEKGKKYRLGEPFSLYLNSNKDVYVLINMYTVDKKVFHLVPNLFEDNKITANQTLTLVGENSKLKLAISKPLGRELLQILVSESPFSKQFKSEKINQDAEIYRNQLKQILLEHMEANIQEYILVIDSTP
ncbi:MAG: DUF4384 domain-containing protein [Gammaproteobacteria bacterium]|nr:DUF4384 domain-containing protein [Gammaproteobacteria bacterium]